MARQSSFLTFFYIYDAIEKKICIQEKMGTALVYQLRFNQSKKENKSCPSPISANQNSFLISVIGTVTAKQWGEGSREFIQKRRKWSEISKGNKQKYEKGKIIFIF